MIDIETAPSEAYIWQAKTEYVPIEMIKKEGYLLSWAAKWLNINPILHSSIRVGMKQCLLKLHKLIDKADVLIAHNGIEFDFKKINSYFLKHNILPPSPYKVIDTLKVARSQFRLTSNKLDFLAGYLGVGHKLVHTGFHLWKGCMSNDKKSWDTMIKYNCLTPDHKVLNNCLKWVEIGSLNIGDKILGFDEELKDCEGTGRKLKESIVVGNRRVVDDVYEVSLSNGDKIKCTKNHKWLCSPYTSKNINSNPHGCMGGSKWRMTSELMAKGKYLNDNKSTRVPNNSSIVFLYFNIVNEIKDKNAGWLSGMFDGEGSLSNRKDNKTNKTGGFSISISQKTGNELSRIGSLLDKYGIRYSINIHSKDYHSRKSNNKIKSTKEIGYITILGNFNEKLEFLQKIRPERLIKNINWHNLPKLEGRNKRVMVENIKHIGKKEIVILETNTKTYIADGYAMHNCHDVKLLEKVYLKMLPWIKNHPNYGLYTRTELVCKNCGSVKLHKRGTAVSRLGVYNRYQCQSCGSWMRDKHKLPDIGKNIVLPVMDI